MRRLENLLRGTVTLEVEGPFPERLLNLCAQQRVDCWGLEWLDAHTLRLVTRRRTLGRLRSLAGRVGCEVRVEQRRGLPFFLGRFRRRYAFLLGLALSLTAVFFLSQFILTIEVTGNETVPAGQILWELRRQGVRPGVYGPSLDRKDIAQRALLELDELSWMSINLYGTRLEVVVREAVKAPELTEEEGSGDVVAKAGGIILQVEPLAGEALVQEGDMVAKGDVLISGLVSMEPPQYSGRPMRYYQTVARGRVWARTWRSLEGAIPLESQVKTYTGEEKTLWSLTMLGRTVDFFKSSSIAWPTYDKITSVYQLTLPGGGAAPMMLTAQRCRSYETTTVSLDRDAAQTMLEQQLLARLEGEIGPEGQVLSHSFEARVDGAMLKVTLTAECREEIGTPVAVQREIPGEQVPAEQESEHQ